MGQTETQSLSNIAGLTHSGQFTVNGILPYPSVGVGVVIGVQVDGSRRCPREQHRTGRLEPNRRVPRACGVFAEFEQAMIQERVRAGLERARAQGKTLGRPRVAEDVERSVRRLRDEGIGKRKIAKQLGVGVSTVMRVLNERRTE